MKWLSLLFLLIVVEVNAATTQMNVLSFGADPTGIRSSDAAFNAACDAARFKYGVYVPGGSSGVNAGAIFKVKSMDMANVPRLYSDAGGLYSASGNIMQEDGATNDMIWFSSATFRPSIENLTFFGKKETNLRNARTITGVASRYQFTVNSAPPDASYTREVFFFLPPASASDTYHYLGSGMVTSIAGTTVNIGAFQDWFATPTAGSGQLTVGTVACFGTRVTENGITVSDPTRAGLSAVNLTGVGGYLILKDVRFEDWHTDIRVGVAVGVDARSTFHRGMNFAGVYHAFPAGSDHRYGLLSGGGSYAPQRGATDTPIPLSDTENRAGKFGAWLSGTALAVDDMQLYGFLRDCQPYFAIPLRINLADLGSSVYEMLVVDNASRVSIGSLWMYNVGSAATTNYAAIQNVNGTLRVDNVDCFPLPAPYDNLASYLVESITTNAQNSFGYFARTNGFAQLEKTPNGLSQITTYSQDDFVVSGRGLNGAFYVFKDPNALYGVGMAGDGTVNDPFRTKLFAFDRTEPGISINNNQRIGIGAVATSTNFNVTIGGDTLINGKVTPVYLFVSQLEGPSVPGTNTQGAAWFASTNSSGVPTFAARYPAGALVYFVDQDGNLGLNSLVATGSVTAATITATTSIDAPLLSLAALNTSTLTVTNTVNYLTTNAVPANTNAAKWVKIQIEGVDYAIPASILP